MLWFDAIALVLVGAALQQHVVSARVAAMERMPAKVEKKNAA